MAFLTPGSAFSDAQLLERFLEGHDEGAESAFNVLVERHGPMVLAVCHRVLNDPHDAQDAFQATFLILVRKAGAIRSRESIADWLHGVARRISARARADLARRRSVELRAVTRTSIACEPSLPEVDVRDEVEHLPQELRAPIVLCYLEGLTHEQAARRLGWPVGTVRSRLARARDRLRADLRRRGIAPDVALLPVLALRRLSLPERLIDTTVKAAMLLTARDAGEAGLISASAVALAEGVLRTMLVSKIKLTATILVAAGAIGSGVGLYAYQGVGPGAARPGVRFDAAPKPVEPIAPPEAVESGAVAKTVDPRMTTGIAAGIAPATVDSGMVIGDELDALAARTEELVQRARREQAEGDWEGASRDLAKSTLAAMDWQEAITKRRMSARSADPFSAKPVANSLSQQTGTGTTSMPQQTGTGTTSSEQSRAGMAGSGGMMMRRGSAVRRGGMAATGVRGQLEDRERLEDLERKVDRILSALEKGGHNQAAPHYTALPPKRLSRGPQEKGGHDQAERPQSAPMNRKPIEELAAIFANPAAINPRAARETDNDEHLTGDLARLQGTWTGTTGTNEHFQTVEAFKGKTGRTDNTTPDGKEIGLIYRFDIDEDAKPHKRMHIYDIARYPGSGGGGPKEVHAIYKFIDDNTIMYCNGFDGQYPAAFENSASAPVCTMTRSRQDLEPAVSSPPAQ